MTRSLASGDRLRRLPSGGRLSPALAGILLSILSGFVSYLVVSRMGVPFLVLAVGGLIAAIALLHVSLRDISIPVLFWLLSMIFYRGILIVHMPALPDFSFDRLMLIWVISIFSVKLIIGRSRLRGPYLADWLILAHTTYVLVQSQMVGSIHFHAWVISNLSPCFAYFIGKYVIEDQKALRNVVLFFLAVSVYYYVQSIAQRLGQDFLVWPKVILDRHAPGLWHEGRSRGPVLHPPLFGQLMAMFLLVHFFLLARERRPLRRSLLAISLALAMLGQLFNYTRGPWLALGVALAVLAVLRRGYRRTLGVLVLVALLAGALGITQLANTEFFQQRMQNTGTIENRMGFLANAMLMIQDHPLFGIGYFRWGEFRGLYNQGVYIPFYGYIKKRMGAETAIHDIYLGRTAEEGLVSALLLLGFTIVVARAFVRQWHANPQQEWFNRDLLALFAAMMACYLVGGMVIDYRYFDLVNVVFFLMAGIIYGYRDDRHHVT